MATAVDLLGQVAQHDEAHDYLHQDCPFFRHIGEGGRDAGDIDAYCQPARGPGRPPRLVVKLTPRTPEASTVPQPTVPPGGPGLFHVRGLELPPYVQHLYKHLVGRYGKHDAYRVAVGVVKKWAQGVHPGGRHKGGKGGRVHADVQSAAAKNVAEWEQDKAAAHEHGRDKVAASAAMLPGAQAQYGLWQRPAATVSPSPPLPPKAELPAPAEVRALAGLVPARAADASLSRTIRKFLETAAVKLEKQTPLEALAALRGAQAAVYATHKKDVSEAPPYPWSAPAPALVPAAQSSATAAMKQSHETTMAYRKLQQEVGALADRIRKNFFGAPYEGPSAVARLAAAREPGPVKLPARLK